jgi:hypothetical protein
LQAYADLRLNKALHPAQAIRREPLAMLMEWHVAFAGGCEKGRLKNVKATQRTLAQSGADRQLYLSF